MDESSLALLRLNLATGDLHDAADAGWRALTRQGITRPTYARWLVTVYGFEAPLESALAYTPNLKRFVDLRQRSRVGFLAKDLRALGLKAHEIAQLPQCALAPFDEPLEALGWLYVSERSTLLHDRVRRHLLARLPDAHDICAYLASYDGVTNARWNELGHILDRAMRSRPRLDELIAAAQSAFRLWNDWSQRAATYARGA